MEVPDSAAVGAISILGVGIVGLWRFYVSRESRVIEALKREHDKELRKRDERLERLESRVQTLEDLRLTQYREHSAALEHLTVRCVNAIDNLALAIQTNILQRKSTA
jgi:hypothetical protein